MIYFCHGHQAQFLEECMKKTLLVVALAFAGLSFGLAQDFVMGINFDAGGKFDKSFNQGTWEGFSSAIAAADADIEILEFEGSPETFAQGLRQMSSEGADLIVAPGFAQVDIIHDISSEFPDTNYLSIDAWPIDGINPNELRVGFAEHEGSYLVGYLAGLMSQTGVVGFVGGMDIPLIHKFNLGYEEGVKAACDTCTVISNYVGTTPAAWNDPARGKELAAAQQAQGADIIYAAAGSSGLGVVDFVTQTMCYTSDNLRTTPLSSTVKVLPKSEEYNAKCGADSQPLFFIGVDSNQNYLGDTDGRVSTLNHGLTSMLKRVDIAAQNAVNAVVDGSFEGGFKALGLAEDGVGWAFDEYNDPLIPNSVVSKMADIRNKIISGEITVTNYFDLQ